jgi:hypothetical protein
MDILDINIKILNDKYEIFLNKILYKSQNIITYLGKNIYDNKKIIIDMYNTNIQILAKKIINNVININHKNIIKIDDIIIEKNITYFIKPYYPQKIKDVKLLKQNDLLYYFEDIIIALEFLYNKNIEIEILNHEQIYIDKNNVIISPYFENNIYPLNIVYGSPIFNTLNINIKNKTDNENKIIKNISILFIELINICLNINIEEINNVQIINNKINTDIYDMYLFLNNNFKIYSLKNILEYIKNNRKEKCNTYKSLIFECEL